MNARSLQLELLDGTLAVCRLDAGAPVPAWAAGPFVSVTRTDAELSVVCSAEGVPAGVRAEGGWRALRVRGPLGFGMTGEINMVEAGRRWGTGNIEFYRDGGATPTTSPKLGLMVTFSHHDYNPAGGGGWKNTTRTRMGATLGSPYALADVPFRSAYHQQRNVFSVATPAYGGTPTRDEFSGLLNEDAYSDEQLRYSPVLATPAINDTDRVFLVGDRPDQIGAMLSVNTNELYIIKAHSGGMIVNGALERPSVNRYPGVESTGSFPIRPFWCHRSEWSTGPRVACSRGRAAISRGSSAPRSTGHSG